MGKTRKNLYADIEQSKLDKDNKESNEPAEGKKASKLRQQTESHRPIHGMSQHERTNAYAELAKMHKAKQSAGKRRRKNKSVKRKSRKNA